MDVCHKPRTFENKEKYEKELLYNHYLPYSNELDNDSDTWLLEIKSNLTRAVLLRELRPGVVTWMSRLIGFINLYGFKFSKKDHLQFIHLAWELLISPNMEPRLMEVFIRALLCLLKRKSLLSPADLELPWRPLYAIFEDLASHNVSLIMKVYPLDFEKNLKNLVKLSRYYFPRSATDEILTQFRPYFCPHDAVMTRALSCCNLFLPTLFVDPVVPAGGDLGSKIEGGWRWSAQPGYTAWLREMEMFWTACYNTPRWEGSLISLFSRLASDNIGCIDWRDATPVLFQRFMHSFMLPVYYKKLGVGLKTAVMASVSMAKWIIATITDGSETLSHLATMMGAINSYYYPTSEGSYSERLVEFLDKLIFFFMSRLNIERFENPDTVTWVPRPEVKHQLSESQVVQFCHIVHPALMNMANSKKYVEHARNNLNILASIRPDIFIPPLLGKLDASLKTLTEPHKFTAAVKCINSVARNLVRPDPLLPDGPAHVLEILYSVVPGIDCNDIKKTMNVFQLISIFARLVPFRDFSQSAPMKHKVKTPEHSFRHFVTIFMDRCFSLIENSTLEQIRQEQSLVDAHMSSEESSINVGIVSCFDSILHQADEKVQDAAIGKLKEFLMGRILEPKISGKIASGLCRTSARIAPTKILPIFLTYVCDILVENLQEVDLQQDMYLGDEIMFNLLLLSDLVCLPGYYLLPYIPRVVEVLTSALRVRNKEGHTSALTVFRHCLHSLTHMGLAERGKIVHQPSNNPLDDWGCPADLTQLDVKWYIPGEEEFKHVQMIVDKFLGEQVDLLNKFIDEEINLDKEDLLRSLKTISSFIIGCSSVLPHWREDPVYLAVTQVDHRPRRHVTTAKGKELVLRLRDCDNTRKFLVELMDRLLSRVMKDRTDDTRVMISIATIFKLLIFQHTTTDEGLDKHQKTYQQSKSRLELKLLGKRKHIRAILIDRVLLQHEIRLVENLHTSFTGTHARIFNLLFQLSTSHYSRVRIHAQAILARCCKIFSYSYNCIVPQVLSKLSPDPSITHEEFKGALYVILQNQLLVKHSWELQCKLWPLLVKAQHNEKPSISALVKSITGYIHSIDNWTIERPDISARVEECVKCLTDSRPSEEETASATANRKLMSDKNLVSYNELASNLCELIESSDLHWRHYNTCLSMICGLLRYDVDFPLRATTIFTNNLIHDNILVRKASIHVIDCLLKKSKRKHPKVSVKLDQVVPVSCAVNFGCGKLNSSDNAVCDNHILDFPNCDGVADLDISAGSSNSSFSFQCASTSPIQSVCDLAVKPGERLDNKFLQYNEENIPRSSEAYDAPRYVHKTHHGFYVWPKEDIIYASSKEQPVLDRTVDQMSQCEQIVYNFFTNSENVLKLFSFLTLEEKKGQDNFDVERFGMFKALFRNFGDLFLESFRVQIEKIVGDHRESYQRAASELIASIIRGSKHWPYEKVVKMWEWVIPVIRTALSCVSPETIRDWGICFATSSDNRDPNKLHWLMEVAMEEPIRSQGSFIDASRLYMLQGVVAQQRWRVGELLHRLLEFLVPFLDHPFHNVRNRLGAVLTNIFALDIQFGDTINANMTSPTEKDFFDKILPSMEQLNDSSRLVSLPDSDTESRLRMLQTVSKWLGSSIALNLGPVKQHVFRLVPVLMQYEWYDRDPQIATDCKFALSCLSRTLLPAHLLPPLVQVLQQTAKSESWKTRLSTLDFLQAFVFNNFMVICSSSLNHGRLREEIVELAVQQLYDVQLEVRVKSSQVLSGLIHCEFIPASEFQTLIEKFKSHLNPGVTGSVDPIVTGNVEPVATSHGAVLGLCAFLSAFPHEVPTFLPDLLIYLGGFLSSKQPITATVKRSVQNFKRTHQDNWSEHKTKFTEDQLSELTNLLISPSYYA